MKLILSIFLCLFVVFSHGQSTDIFYDYDDAGNLILKYPGDICLTVEFDPEIITVPANIPVAGCDFDVFIEYACNGCIINVFEGESVNADTNTSPPVGSSSDSSLELPNLCDGRYYLEIIVFIDDVECVYFEDFTISEGSGSERLATPITKDKIEVNPTEISNEANISISLSQDAIISLRVFDVVGKPIAVISEETLRSAGTHTFEFATDNLAPGVYTFTLETNNIVISDIGIKQ